MLVPAGLAFTECWTGHVCLIEPAYTKTPYCPVVSSRDVTRVLDQLEIHEAIAVRQVVGARSTKQARELQYSKCNVQSLNLASGWVVAFERYPDGSEVARAA
jgi:hypothetical protein